MFSCCDATIVPPLTATGIAASMTGLKNHHHEHNGAPEACAWRPVPCPVALAQWEQAARAADRVRLRRLASCQRVMVVPYQPEQI